MLNDPTPRSLALRARALVLINGEIALPVAHFRVDQNTFYQADTFEVTFALSAMPANRGADWWATLYDAELQAFVGYPADPDHPQPGELYQAVVGNIDDIEIDRFADEVRVVGRDLTAAFIDNKTVDQYVNLTSSEIVTRLAAARGLKPVVTQTTTPAGGYYRQDHVSLVDSRPEWDLMTYLAEREGFQVYVKGRELHFEPRTDMDVSNAYTIRARLIDGVWHSNALQFACRRNLTLSRTVKVVVRSANAKQPKGFTVTAEVRRVRNRVIGGVQKQSQPVQEYTYRVPGLQVQEAQELANRRANEISRHEMNLRCLLVGDDLLTPRTPIRVDGTGTAFDQVYYPSSIVRTWSLDVGYTMDVEAKNHSPEAQVLP